MSYRQYKPDSSLQNYIDAYWVVRSDSMHNRILPDGCVDLICNLGSPVISNNTILAPDHVYLVGTMTRFAETVGESNALLLGIRFKPGTFGLFYDMPLPEATDQCIEFDRSLLDAKDDLNKYFSNKKKKSSHVLLLVIEDMMQQKGTEKISTVSKKHFITERQLERNFKQYTGIGPKAFSNIIRFRSIMEQIKNNPAKNSLETIAFMNGYYDHAHLTNEIKKYTGYTPAQL